jgi:hypothetical protein
MVTGRAREKDDYRWWRGFSRSLASSLSIAYHVSQPTVHSCVGKEGHEDRFRARETDKVRKKASELLRKKKQEKRPKRHEKDAVQRRR